MLNQTIFIYIYIFFFNLIALKLLNGRYFNVGIADLQIYHLIEIVKPIKKQYAVLHFPLTCWCFMSVFFPRWWWLPVGVGWAAGDLPQRPSRAPPTLPAGAGGRLHHQEQSCQSLLHGHTCCSDLLQVQRRVGPSERTHHRGACGRDVGSVAHTHTLTHTHSHTPSLSFMGRKHYGLF